jgi:hypothetical protein
MSQRRSGLDKQRSSSHLQSGKSRLGGSGNSMKLGRGGTVAT